MIERRGTTTFLTRNAAHPTRVCEQALARIGATVAHDEDTPLIVLATFTSPSSPEEERHLRIEIDAMRGRLHKLTMLAGERRDFDRFKQALREMNYLNETEEEREFLEGRADWSRLWHAFLCTGGTAVFAWWSGSFIALAALPLLAVTGWLVAMWKGIDRYRRGMRFKLRQRAVDRLLEEELDRTSDFALYLLLTVAIPVGIWSFLAADGNLVLLEWSFAFGLGYCLALLNDSMRPDFPSPRAPKAHV